MAPETWFVYIIRCSDGSLYTGATNDLATRICAHNSGTGAKYTRSRRPVRLVWSRACLNKSEALRREAKIKSLNKFEKEKILPWFGRVEILHRRNEMLRLHEKACPPLTENLDVPTSMNLLSNLCSSGALGVRDFLVHRYAWGTPTERILRKIQEPGPIVEMGAGSGYWAWLLRTLGADIEAYDYFTGSTRNLNVNSLDSISWTKVRFGSPKVLTEHSDRTLFLCWAPTDSMAFSCLDYWKGDILMYVGDESMTSDERFQTRLHTEFDLCESIPAPSWPGICDSLTVWRRK